MLKKVIREKDKEKLDMNVFKELGKDLNYKDILQVDGAFSACHINYGKSLKFNGADSKNMAQNSRKNSLTETFDLSVKIPGSVHMSVNYKEQTISVIGSDNQLKRLYKVTTAANQS